MLSNEMNMVYGRDVLPSSWHGDTGGNGEFTIDTSAASLDPDAGGTYGDKPIWDVNSISDNLNRTGYDWYTNNGTVLDDGVINFGFWNSQDDFFGSGYINDDFTIAFSEFFDFQAFTPEQRDAARGAIGLWDDLVSISFVETDNILDADIRYGNTDTGGAQAYAYLPFGDIFNDLYSQPENGGFSKINDLGGDVWVDYNVGSNFFPLEDSYYSIITLIHETGHALGLSHPGDYDALDDNDGDGVPDPITYENDAFYAQDSLQYTVMSYFDAYETGAQHIDWTLLNFAYAATPLVHDIAAIQAIYGADTTTRTGDTVYGFNSNADRDAYNFDINTRPIVAIYDAGGIDAIDFSGWDTPSIINLNEGAFSSGGGTEEFLSLAEVNANRAELGFAPRSQATYDLYFSLFAGPQGLTDGLFHDNVSIAYGTVIENAVGGGGDDLIIANQVANRIDGGLGSDTVSYETAESGVIVNMAARGGISASGGAAGDKLISIENLTGSAYNDTLIGNSGDNIIDGGSGGNDTLVGGAGIDTLSYASAGEGIVINMRTGDASGGAAGDSFSGFENAIGSAYDDTIYAGNDDNVVFGGDGDDKLYGKAGDDTLYGEAGVDRLFGWVGDDTLIGGDGNDYLYGEGDNDTLNGGAGSDLLNGGTGNDIFVFTDVDGSTDRIVDLSDANDTIDLSGIDAIAGTESDDAFTFIGATGFSNTAGELRYASGVIQGDVDGDGVADFSIVIGAGHVLDTGVLVL